MTISRATGTTKGTGIFSAILRAGAFIPTIIAGARCLEHYKLLRNHPELEHSPYNTHTISAQYTVAVAVRVLSRFNRLYRAQELYTDLKLAGHFLLLMVHIIIPTVFLLSSECNLRNRMC